MSNAAEKIDDNLEQGLAVKEETIDVDAMENQAREEEQAEEETIIRHYLRLLTAEELSEIASVFDSASMISLTDCLAKDLDLDKKEADEAEEEGDGKAKIIPFEQVGQDDEDSDEDYHFDKYDEELKELEEKHVVQVNKNGGFSIYDHEEEIRRKRQELKKVNLGEFILKQKKKFAKSQKKLKKKEIYLMYKNNSTVDVKSSKDDDDKSQGIKISTNTGLLINKKQK